MVTVEFLGPIQLPSRQIEVQSLRDLAALLKKEAEIEPWLEGAAVAINDTLVASLDVTLKDGDRVSLLPPVCGG